MSRASVRLHEERHDEKGVVLVAAALLLVFLLIVAAFAIDLGNVRQRQVDLQAVADLAALAGAQDLPEGSDAMEEALDSVQLNLGIGRNAWNGCSDAGALQNVVVLLDVTNSNCISFNENYTIIRVTLPPQAITTYFGGVVGIGSFDVRTTAEAAAIVARSNRIIPATVSASVEPGLRCVESSGANTGCPNHVDGFFGTILSPRLHQFKPSSGNYNGEAQALNFALNLDHDVVPYDPADPAVCDGTIWSPCTSSNVNNPAVVGNHLIISTGNSVPPVTEGLVTGGTTQTSDFGAVSFCGRLTRPDFDADNALDPLPGNCQNPGTPTITHIGQTINGRHVFRWLTPSAQALFYPEVVVDPITGEPPLTHASYQAGDARLQCFLDGYRLDVATGLETVPDCTGQGLVINDPSILTYQSTWTAGYTSYADPGVPALAGPWIEPATDSGEDRGHFKLDPLAGQIVVTKRAPSTQAIEREISIPAGTDALRLKGHLFLDFTNLFALEYSFDNVNWLAAASIDTAQLFVHDVLIETGDASSIFIRYRRQTDANNNGALQTSTLSIDFYTLVLPAGVTRIVDPIFMPEMVQDPRFGAIPIILDWPASGTKAAPITGFWYAYIYHLYGNNTKVQAFDSWVFDPSLAGHDRSTAFAGYGFDLNSFIRLEK